MIQVKICGIMDAGTAQAAIDVGADMLGFHVGDVHGSKNIIDAARARAIIGALPPNVTSVLVSTSIDIEKVIATARDLGVGAVQFHGDIGPKQILQAKEALPGVKVWKTIHVQGEQTLEDAGRFDGIADMVLLDTSGKATGQVGGTGKTHDWNVSRSVAEALTVPVMLAGGLNPENVADALRTVRPYAVDVNSGVSNPDGTKDFAKVRLFVERAKTA